MFRIRNLLALLVLGAAAPLAAPVSVAAEGIDAVNDPTINESLQIDSRRATPVMRASSAGFFGLGTPQMPRAGHNYSAVDDALRLHHIR